jgi:hypothetical protein
MLIRTSPGNGNIGLFTASSKDHLEAASGTTVGTVSRIRRGP